MRDMSGGHGTVKSDHFAVRSHLSQGLRSGMAAEKANMSNVRAYQLRLLCHIFLA